MISRIDLSIVIPCYNTKKYVDKCLTSVLSQLTEFTYEVIVVDDCSPDNISEYLRATYDKNTTLNIVSHSKNKGLSGARNTGISHSNGKYICFLDSDDWLNLNYIEEMISTALEKDADLVIADYAHVYSDNTIEEMKSIPLNKISYSHEEYIALSRTQSCIKLYKRSLLENYNIWFDESQKRFEDFSFVLQCLVHSNIIQYVPKVLYYYRQHENSLSNTNVAKMDLSFFENAIENFHNAVSETKYKRFEESIVFQKLHQVLYSITYLMILTGYSNRKIVSEIDRFLVLNVSEYLNKENRYMKDISRLKSLFVKFALDKNVVFLRFLVFARRLTRKSKG